MEKQQKEVLDLALQAAKMSPAQVAALQMRPVRVFKTSLETRRRANERRLAKLAGLSPGQLAALKRRNAQLRKAAAIRRAANLNYVQKQMLKQKRASIARRRRAAMTPAQRAAANARAAAAGKKRRAARALMKNPAVGTFGRGAGMRVKRAGVGMIKPRLWLPRKPTAFNKCYAEKKTAIYNDVIQQGYQGAEIGPAMMRIAHGLCGKKATPEMLRIRKLAREQAARRKIEAQLIADASRLSRVQSQIAKNRGQSTYARYKAKKPLGRKPLTATQKRALVARLQAGKARKAAMA